jgi:outer membrane receptor protein involved in Fe transport
MHDSAKRLVLVLAVLSLLAQFSFAQTETGQVTGTVLDESGGVVMSATITITDVASNTQRTSMTGDGSYVFPNLLPGRYTVSASAPGFQTVRQTVTVNVGVKIGVDLKLPVGTQTQVVEVAEQAVAVNTETQTVGANISGKEIVDLPTFSRNPYDLVQTVGNTTSADPGGADRGVGVSINGLRAEAVGILLDGVPNVNKFDTTVATQVPLDSVGEITVLTSNFTAEYGRAVSGVINVDTKRGTNDFHGSAYEFMRLSALTSNTYDNNANGIPKSVFVRNNFGFSIGGPVKKDKLFLFVNPEWLRIRSQAITTATIATPQLIAASNAATQNFFSTFGQLKSGLSVLQMFNRSAVCTTGACTNIAANTPIYEKVAYSVPSDSGGGSPENQFELVGRGDYVASDKTQVYFRYARRRADIFPGTVVNSPYVGYDTGETVGADSYALSGTHIFSPNTVSQTKLSYNRISLLQPLGSAPVAPTLYTTLSATNQLGGASIIYPGYSPFTPGNSIPFGGPQNYYQVNEDFTKVWGKHNFRFGGLYTFINDNRVFGAYENAVAALGTTVSSAVNGLVSGQLHDFQAAIYPQGKFPCSNKVVNAACTLTLPVGPPSFSRSNIYHESGLYVQDSWKLSRRATVNLGLRWEYYSPQHNRNQALDSNFFFGTGSNVELQSATGQVLTSTDPNNPIGGLWRKDHKDFMPRVGFAYDLFGDGKTALRGGYGLGYIPNFGNVTFNVIQNPPNYGVIALTAGADVPTIPITTNNAGPLAGSSGTKALGAVTLRAVDPNIKTARAHTWSAAIEHQFSNQVLGALEYTGSKGEDLNSIDRLNIPGSAAVYGSTFAYAGGVTATTRINPQYSYINFRTGGGFSHYNALNARMEMNNFKKQGLTLRANYTWSHAIDNLSNTFSETNSGSGNLGFLDPLNPGLDKGSADFDVRHRFTVVGIYEVPYKSSNKVLQNVAGGWSVIPNFSARTGTPFTVYDCNNAGYVLCPRVMYTTPYSPSVNVVPTDGANQFNYINLGNFNSSYLNPAAGVSDFGPFPSSMRGRNSFQGPGVWNLDLAVHKNFTINERFKLQFRAEAYNAFNHSNLYVVYSNTDVSATNFVTAQKGIRQDSNAVGYAGENRRFQLALKLLF